MKKYKDYKIEELRDLCKERGLETNGKKEILVSRLLKADDVTAKSPDIFSQKVSNELDINSNKITTSLSNENYYLQIKASNLSNYFNFGYFYPIALEESDIYKNENRAKDILSIFQDYILVGKTPFNKFENTDVLVELVLNGIKVDEYENSGLYYIAEPIPISRVKSILFKSNSEKATFTSSIKTFPDSFIPYSICKTISSEEDIIKKVDFEKVKLPENKSLLDWKIRLDLFDKILGLFAFIKNVGIFYAERESKFENYSSGFLGAINLINPIKQLSAYKENTYLKPLLHYRNLEINNVQRTIFKSIIDRVYENKTFDIKTAIEILDTSIVNESSKNEDLDIRNLIILFKQLDNLTVSYKGLLQKEILRKNLPVLALLFLSKFPNKSRQNTDKQAVRVSFIEGEYGVSQNVTEYILGFLGLYYGYKNMIKEDTNLKFLDKNFEILSANTQSIKFKLDSYFDRFIIESAFQFSVKQIVLDDTFDFLNWDSDKEENILNRIPIHSSYQYDYSYTSFKILGENIYNILRQDKKEKVFDTIANLYSEKIASTSYLATFLTKYLHFEKRQVLELLIKNKGRYPLDELERVIDLDIQNKKR